jgi:iron complex outermembrane receptor protein
MISLKTTFIITILMFSTLKGYGQPANTTVTGQVLKLENNRPVPYANVIVSGTRYGTACDSAGIFKLVLGQGEHELEISAIGFKPVLNTITIDNTEPLQIVILLPTAIINYSEEILVYGQKESIQNMEWFNSNEDLINRVEGVSMIRRANFAMEPTIRGMSGGRLGVMVDGMKIFGACIDRMDPVTAYVETDNLEKLTVTKGAFDMTKALSLGGTINMITNKPAFNQSLFFRTEVGYESVSELKKVRALINYADSSTAFRATFSVKKSKDFLAGQSHRIFQSGYFKNNYKFDVTKIISVNQTLELSFIGDNARDIGYPPLLMDARQTKSQIFRLEHNWHNPFSLLKSISSKLYYNRIDHWMDDYDREVTTRVVMPDMYMPMYGKTKTLGLVEQINIIVGNHQFDLIFDFYRLSAFADMKMISIFQGVSDAYLINLGDILLDHIAAVVNYNWIISERSWIRTNMRYDHSSRDIKNEFGRRQLKGFWDLDELKKDYSFLSISSSMEYNIANNQTITLSLALSHRLPTHIENYGFFLYEITDGYFYTGNPQIKPEQSRQIELSLSQVFNPINFHMKVYYFNIKDYISGLLFSDEFKIYSNIASVILAGGEIGGNVNLTGSLSLYASAEYTYGQNHTLNEPLPFIPPLEGHFGLNYQQKSLGFNLDCRVVKNQNRIAIYSTLEDVTNGFVLVNLHSRIQLLKNLQARFGMENIFDILYHEHLSINNFPGRGRNIYGGLTFKFGI